MRILDRLLTLFDGRRRTLFGAVGQPDDLKGYLYAVRAQAYQRITGKSLTRMDITSSKATDMKKDLSPSKRLSRRDLH